MIAPAIAVLSRAQIGALRRKYKLFWLPAVPRTLKRRKS